VHLPYLPAARQLSGRRPVKDVRDGLIHLLLYLCELDRFHAGRNRHLGSPRLATQVYRKTQSYRRVIRGLGLNGDCPSRSVVS
jgi:hypothetical protein